ncbi:MAG: hypothetical protein ACRELC_05400, partial [Gemmatimonadota bacterium]
CDFPSAQVQARRVVLRILGRRDGALLRIRFREAGLDPVGSRDLGGFVRLLPRLRLTLEERADAQVRAPVRLEDPEGEVYAAVTVVRLAG